MLEIRAKTPADDDACVELMRRTHAQDGYPRYWPSRPARFLRPRQETDSWVAELDGRAVGQVALHDAANDPVLPVAHAATALPPERLAVLARLLVDPEVQRQGVGRTLVRTATNRAHAAGRRPVLDVQQESVGAMGLYESEGFRRIGEVSLDLAGLDYGDVPPLRLWVYLGPAVPAD